MGTRRKRVLLLAVAWSSVWRKHGCHLRACWLFALSSKASIGKVSLPSLQRGVYIKSVTKWKPFSQMALLPSGRRPLLKVTGNISIPWELIVRAEGFQVPTQAPPWAESVSESGSRLIGKARWSSTSAHSDLYYHASDTSSSSNPATSLCSY